MPENHNLSVTSPDAVRGDLLVIGCCEGQTPDLIGFPEPVRHAAEALLARRGWEGGEKQYVETAVESEQVSAVGLQGLGKEPELTARKVGLWLHKAVERGRNNGLERLVLCLPEHPLTRGEDSAERVSRHAAHALYRFDQYFTDARAQPRPLGELELVAPSGEEETYRQAVAIALPVAAAIAYCRDLANTPGNVAHPEWLEAQARALAESRGMELRVLHRRELEERGMGGLLAVGGGSDREPRLVRLDWGRGERTVALVGKGVTFDTGGICLKPAADLDEMKYDKAGACTVLGIARAVCDLGLPLRLRVYLPLAENMPDGSAYRPGDIVRCYNGKTVEILNTDAEGRMILADALAWAVEEQPDALLEFSTLTGGSVVALGQQAGSLYTPDDDLAKGLLEAAEACGERLWRMPLWPEFREQVKGSQADLRNAAGRWGSANTAAAFLSQFVGDMERWAHLDMAGPAHVGNDRDEPPGATGYGVALGVRWLRRGSF